MILRSYGKQEGRGAHTVERLQLSFTPFVIYLCVCVFAVQFRISSFFMVYWKALKT